MTRIPITFEQFVRLVMDIGNHDQSELAEVEDGVRAWAKEQHVSFAN